MKKTVLIAIILGILILDWLALDDITTGNEPDYFGEYATLLLSVPALIVSFLKLKNHGK